MYLSRKGSVSLLTVLILLVFGFTNLIFAQDIILKDLESQPVNLSRYKGNPTILFFWTTWCPYCRKEIKALNQMYPQLKKEGIALFGVDIGELDYKVTRFIQDNAISFRVLLDRNSAAAYDYEVIGVPTYILLDKDGRVIMQSNSLPADYKNLLKNNLWSKK